MKILTLIFTLLFSTFMFQSPSYAQVILICEGAIIRDLSPLRKDRERKSFLIDLEKKFVETDYGILKDCRIGRKNVYCHSESNRDYVHQLTIDRLSGDVSQQYDNPQLNLQFSFVGLCIKTKKSVF